VYLIFYLLSLPMTTKVKPIQKSLGHFAFSQKVNEYQLFDSARATEIKSKVRLHANGDWGQIDPQDAKANNLAVEEHDGGRIHSVYTLSDGTKIWIITSGYGTPKSAMDLNTYSEMDYTNTVVLFPEEY